jgi:hypothetical protein
MRLRAWQGFGRGGTATEETAPVGVRWKNGCYRRMNVEKVDRS